MNAIQKHRYLKKIERLAKELGGIQSDLDKMDAGIDVTRYVELMKEPMTLIHQNIKVTKSTKNGITN